MQNKGIQPQEVPAHNKPMQERLKIHTIYKLNGVDMSEVNVYSNCLIVLDDGMCVDIEVPNDADADEIIRIYSDLCDSKQQS